MSRSVAFLLIARKVELLQVSTLITQRPSHTLQKRYMSTNTAIAIAKTPHPQTNFRDGPGKVYMTHPTKALHKFMMQDFVRMRYFIPPLPHFILISNCAHLSSSSSEAFFSPLDLSMSLDLIIPVSAHQLINVCPGVSFTPYHAGHVLGAAMFMIDIAGLKVLYTGDYSREEDRHLVKAELPPVKPDVLIVESTFGVHTLEARETKEARFTNLVHTIIKRGGHVLMPTFALGRAQELLLILDEYWKNHPDLHNVPIYYASSLARKSMAVYQTYIHTMNANIRNRFAKRDNPFIFSYVFRPATFSYPLTSLPSRHISHLGQNRGWEKKVAEGPPCVVLASPGFLQNGPSRELLELIAPDPKNGLIVTGYSVEGTMARVSSLPSTGGGSFLYITSIRAIRSISPSTISGRHEPPPCDPELVF